MSVIKESLQRLADLPEDDSTEKPERIGCPNTLRALHDRFSEADQWTSDNRAIVQELMDFVAPYDEKKLEEVGQGDRFNVNFGLAASVKNEAVGAYLDIFTSPVTLAKIPLKPEVDESQRELWSDEMAQEFTTMIRSWDGMTSNVLLLADQFVTHGIGIPWFEDQNNLLFKVGGLEDFKFDAEAVAIPSQIECFTLEREFSIPELFAKIEGKEDQDEVNGWNVAQIKALITAAKPAGVETNWNYERAARLVKSSRTTYGNLLPTVKVIWGVVRELDGQISVYACGKDCATYDRTKIKADKAKMLDALEAGGEEVWLYQKRNSYKDANRCFQIFPFSVGNKNKIYTIRGLGYFLHEAGQADNILRCKMMDAAMHRSGEMFQSTNKIDSLDDVKFIDLGGAMIAPPALKSIQVPNTQQLDRTIGFAISSNGEMIQRHSAGLSSSSLVDNPNARRNELQVTAELEHMNKMTGFAIELFYTPWDKLIRELVRRAFQETQTDLVAKALVKRMKDRLLAKGIPEEVFDQIDLEAVVSTRVIGAGSRSSRIIAFQQMSQLYSSMDPQGQENFMQDFATEMGGAEKAIRYFGVPGIRRGHTDQTIAQLENNDLLESEWVEPVDGENRIVHLGIHLEALTSGIEAVNEGSADLAEWTMHNIMLFRHSVDTLERTTVHPSMQSVLNGYRQQIQQVGEIIDNGLRHINKLQEEGKLAPTQDGQPQMGPDGQPVEGQQQDPAVAQQKQEMAASEMDHQLRLRQMFAEGMAKIQMAKVTTQAQIALDKMKAMAEIGTMDIKTAAEVRRKEAMAKAGGN